MYGNNKNASLVTGAGTSTGTSTSSSSWNNSSYSNQSYERIRSSSTPIAPSIVQQSPYSHTNNNDNRYMPNLDEGEEENTSNLTGVGVSTISSTSTSSIRGRSRIR